MIYWFGTDMLGRDIYSRTDLRRPGPRCEVGFSGGSAIIVRGRHDCSASAPVSSARSTAIVMRVMDGLMSIPTILLAIAFMALLGASVPNVVITVSIAEIPRVVAPGAGRCPIFARTGLMLRQRLASGTQHS